MKPVEANRNNREHFNDLKKDYTDFLSQLKSSSSHPLIFICGPPGMNLKAPEEVTWVSIMPGSLRLGWEN